MLQDCLLIRSDGVRYRLMGAESFEDTPNLEIETVYYRGTPSRLIAKTTDRVGVLVVYDSPIVRATDHTVTLAFESEERGLRTLFVYPNSRYTVYQSPHKTETDSVDPEITTIEFQPLPSRHNRFLTLTLEIRERLVGTGNYERLKNTLYRQNGSYSDLQDLIRSGELEDRKFKVIYNQDGEWELSGPSDQITSTPKGWEVEGAQYDETAGTFTIYDDYEEETLWRL